MKATMYYRSNSASRHSLPYPNAATRRQLLNKFLDLLLIAACGMGMAATVALLLIIL